MNKFKVKLGLGRMSNNIPREYVIDAKDENSAIVQAKFIYRRTVGDEIGHGAAIWGKILTIASVELVL